MDKFTLMIGNKNYSSWSLRPWVLMKYFKIPFDEIVIPLRQPGSKEKVLEHSPAGKVPILKHGNLNVWESIAIAEYLADVFPQKNLWPKDLKKRAQARVVSAEMHAGFQALRTACPMNVKARKTIKEMTPEIERDIKRINQMWNEAREQNQKDGDFLFGPFSIVDAMYAPIVLRIQTYGIEVSGLAKKYGETMLNVPVMKEWSEAAVKEIH